MRYAYIETDVKLWNESRTPLVAAAKANAGFLLARRRAPRALDGVALSYSGGFLVAVAPPCLAAFR